MPFENHLSHVAISVAVFECSFVYPVLFCFAKKIPLPASHMALAYGFSAMVSNVIPVGRQSYMVPINCTTTCIEHVRTCHGASPDSDIGVCACLPVTFPCLGGSGYRTGRGEGAKPYYIPLRAMLVGGASNLLVAGKTMSQVPDMHGGCCLIQTILRATRDWALTIP